MHAQYIVRIQYAFDSDEFLYLENPTSDLFSSLLSVQNFDSIYGILESTGIMFSNNGYINNLLERFMEGQSSLGNIMEWCEGFYTYKIITEVLIPEFSEKYNENLFVSYKFFFSVWKFEGEIILVDLFGNTAVNYDEAFLWNKSNRTQGIMCQNCFYPIIKKLDNLNSLNNEERRKFGF